MIPYGATHFNPVTKLYYRKNGAVIKYWSEDMWVESHYPPYEFIRAKHMEQL